MARIRTIKPQFWDDEKIGKLSFGARLLFIGSWNYADDEGILTWNPRYLKSKVFPYDDHITMRHVKTWMEELTSAKFVQKITMCNEDTYGFITHMRQHQNINRPQKTSHPDVLESILKQNSLNTHGTITDDSVLEKEEEGNKEGNKEEEVYSDDSVKKDIPNKLSFDDFLNEQQKKYLELNVTEEWRKCELWWSEGKKPMKRPKTALVNWLDIARKKKQEGKGNGTNREGKGNGTNRTGVKPIPGQKPGGAFSDLE